MLHSRRSTLQGMAAAALATTAHAARSGFFGSHRPLGLQLYTLGDVARTALQDTLTKVAALGYQCVELAGLHGHTPEELRAAANAAGLKFSSIHVQATGNGSDFALDGDLPALAAKLHTLGTSRLAMPMFAMPSRIAPKAADESFAQYLGRAVTQLNADDWKRTADFLNAKSVPLLREGLRLSYHNHNCEFSPLDSGKTGLEILMQATDRKTVSFEMDAGWVAAAGLDPVRVLHQYPGRFTQMHVKDIGAGTRTNYALLQEPREVGRGKMNWKAILPAAKRAGIDQFFVEQEPPFAIDRFEAIAISSKFLLSL
jgi:sugar phosphate isomerase/epimerase